MNTIVPSTPQMQGVRSGVFDPAHLSAVGFVDFAGSNADLELEPIAYKHSLMAGPVGGPFTTMTSLNGSSAVELKQESLVGGSENLHEVVLETVAHGLVPGGGAEDQVTGSHALYEWVEDGLQLVNMGNEGGPVSPCGARLGQGGREHGHAAYSAVSNDGTKIFFTAPDPEPQEQGQGCWNPTASPQENPPEVYMRERKSDNSERTVELSVPEAGVKITAENPLLPAAFVGASGDGSKVFFVTKTQLTSDDKGHAPELYEYNTQPSSGERTLTRISGGGTSGEGNIDFIGAISKDGSAVYFAAFGKLVPGTPTSEPPGSVNLYRYDTLTGKTTFVATIDSAGFPLINHNLDWAANWTESPGAFGGPSAGRAQSIGLVSGAEWYTTGDGNFLVFGSYRPITGFDNNHPQGTFPCARLLHEGVAPESCMELYRYDATTGGIVCVSCTGGAPIDNATFARDAIGLNSSASPRPISEDGSLVFFDTENVLVPQATPGRVHVYEWHEGTISLISPSGDPGEAFFLGSSSDGHDVFFTTHAQLGPKDTDQATDIYDARVDGGFGGVAPPACTGTGCQGVPAATPVFATPPSVTFEGSGNLPAPKARGPKPKAKLKPKKCKQRQRRRHGSCKRRAKKPVKGGR